VEVGSSGMLQRHKMSTMLVGNCLIVRGAIIPKDEPIQVKSLQVSQDDHMQLNAYVVEVGTGNVTEGRNQIM
jgi:hypothetical protein